MKTRPARFCDAPARGGLVRVCRARIVAPMRWVAVSFMALWASMAGAQEPTGARTVAQFSAWARDAGVPYAAFTLKRDGLAVQDVQIGDVPADGVYEFASLGKAITALCAGTLLQSGAWQPETTSKEVLRTGPAGLTVRALLTHSAGLGPDQTQGLMPIWLDKNEDLQPVAVDRALSRGTQTGEAGRFAYNNENYAILGEMIAQQTGQSYVRYCTDAVLIPAGARSAKPSARTGAFVSWGGWEMTLDDYAAFHRWAFEPEGIVGPDPAAWPQVGASGGASYGMGTFQRPFREGYNYWHFGALCFPGRLNVGSYVVQFANGWQGVAVYGGCLDWDTMFALDAALVRGIFGP